MERNMQINCLDFFAVQHFAIGSGIPYVQKGWTASLPHPNSSLVLVLWS